MKTIDLELLESVLDDYLPANWKKEVMGDCERFAHTSAEDDVTCPADPLETSPLDIVARLYDMMIDKGNIVPGDRCTWVNSRLFRAYYGFDPVNPGDTVQYKCDGIDPPEEIGFKFHTVKNAGIAINDAPCIELENIPNVQWRADRFVRVV